MSFPRLLTRRLAALILAPALSAALLSSPASAAPNKGSAPSQNFDLSHWKLTIPTGIDIQNAELNSGYQYDGAFFTDARNGGMVFRCPNLAGTTSNSHYSRSELREMRAPEGSTSADANNWTTDVTGVMRARLRVDRVSTTGDAAKVGRVVIGQIHGPDSEVIRLYYTKLPGEAKGRIYAGMDDTEDHNTYSTDIVPNSDGQGIALGEPFSYVISLVKTRLVVVVRTKDGHVWNYIKSIDPRYKGMNLYFKAGVYNQNNTGDKADFVQATFFSLSQWHP
jgi:hypothetical protein